ncbi:MAG: hypothetical protein A2W35_03425 [Chloroflexi bacterium RBG_16_57_11]|nr:MAG: hypothetical protein A2W35_03425 [Chloroflexi bacterium RBG_16_57_11]
MNFSLEARFGQGFKDILLYVNTTGRRGIGMAPAMKMLYIRRMLLTSLRVITTPTQGAYHPRMIIA